MDNARKCQCAAIIDASSPPPRKIFSRLVVDVNAVGQNICFTCSRLLIELVVELPRYFGVSDGLTSTHLPEDLAAASLTRRLEHVNLLTRRTSRPATQMRKQRAERSQLCLVQDQNFLAVEFGQKRQKSGHGLHSCRHGVVVWWCDDDTHSEKASNDTDDMHIV